MWVFTLSATWHDTLNSLSVGRGEKAIFTMAFFTTIIRMLQLFAFLLIEVFIIKTSRGLQILNKEGKTE